MSNINIERLEKDEKVVFDFSGVIDENTDLSKSELGLAKEIILNLKEISAINSYGIRSWIIWIRTAPENCRIIYKSCPKIIVDQINMVIGFLPKNGNVESFYVPYYCESCDIEKKILFRNGIEFNSDSICPPENICCDKCDGAIKIDVIEKNTLNF